MKMTCLLTMIVALTACASATTNPHDVVILPDQQKLEGRNCEFLGDVRASGLGYTAGHTDQLFNQTVERGGNVLVSDYTHGFSKPKGKAFRCSARVYSDLKEPLAL